MFPTEFRKGSPVPDFQTARVQVDTVRRRHLLLAYPFGMRRPASNAAAKNCPHRARIHYIQGVAPRSAARIETRDLLQSARPRRRTNSVYGKATVPVGGVSSQWYLFVRQVSTRRVLLQGVPEKTLENT